MVTKAYLNLNAPTHSQGSAGVAIPNPRLPLSRLGGRNKLVALIQRLVAWQRRMAERYTLAELDDFLLEDIGLTRADVARELRKPFWTV